MDQTSYGIVKMGVISVSGMCVCACVGSTSTHHTSLLADGMGAEYGRGHHA